MSLAYAYAAWARDAGFVEDLHDSGWVGTIDGVVVRLDNGVRASGRYKVELHVQVATGERLGTIGDGETSSLRAALSSMRTDEVCSVRIDADAVVVRMLPETSPHAVFDVAMRVVRLCRDPATGPYR